MTIKSYRTLWKMHIWGYTDDKMIFSVSSILLLAGIIFGFVIDIALGLFIGFFGVLFMAYHLKSSIYWWKRENRMFDYQMSMAPMPKDEEACIECGGNWCEWLQENEGNCCNDNDDIELFKGCPPCNEDKLADMIDTQRDIEKEKNI